MIWNAKDKQIEYGKKTLIMAIINITPDSFSDGGKYFDPENAITAAVFAEKYGADIIDFGAQSTRPGYEEIDDIKEWSRLEKVLKLANKKINIPISVDTYYPSVAEKAIKNGADIINDVSGEVSEKMAKLVKKTGAGWIVMHSGEGGVNEVREFFDLSAKKLDELGVDKSRICFDMGIGFKKTREQDLELITNIKSYKKEGYPLLMGVSRKRVIGFGSGQVLPSERTYGNIAADTVAIFGGVDIIRLHDVKNEKQGIYMADKLKSGTLDDDDAPMDL